MQGTKILPLFPTLIYETSFPREFNEKEVNAYNEVLEDTYDNVNNIISTEEYALNKYDGFSEIKKFIEVHLNQYTHRVYEFGRKHKIHITSSWLNLTKPGMSHHIHAHPNSFISGVFYFETLDDDCLVFHSRNSKQSHLIPHTNRGNIIGDIHRNRVNKGTLLLFPSWLDHSVEKNKEDKNRISLSFNTYVKGPFGDGISFVEI